MWDVNYDIKELLPKEKKGYDFIKRTKLYIPFLEIGINVLVRKEQQLPLLTEIILNLIDSKCSSVINISEVTGVEEEIIDNVIGEMAAANLVYIRSSNIVLTPQGETALSTLHETIIEKEEINRIFINAINGEIVELDKVLKRPDRSGACLDEQIKIDEGYIAEQFNYFNEFYQKRQEDLDVTDSGGMARNEIYQILSKTYENLCYLEKPLDIYMNIKDNDLVFECETEKDSIYAAMLASQMHRSVGARNFLLNKFQVERYKGNKYILDGTKIKNTNDLTSFVQANTKNRVNSEEFDNLFYVERYLIHGEFKKLLNMLSAIRPSELLISADNLSELFNDSFIGLLQSIINNFDTKVAIICDKKDNSRQRVKSMLMKPNTKQKNISWTEKDDLNKIVVIIDKACAITVDFIPLSVGNDFLIKESAEITFDKKYIDKIHQEVVELLTS